LTSELIEATKVSHQWQRSPIIAAVTSNNPHKNNPALIHMLNELLRQAPDVDWKLKIAGRGAFAAEKALAKQLGIEQRIHWCGFLSVDEMDVLFRESLCHTFTSFVEGFGNTPLEAMARSCPVVASNNTAIPEVCGNAAILLDANDHAGFASAVIRYWNDPALRRDAVSKGLKQAQNFQWVNSARKMFQVIEAVARSEEPDFSRISSINSSPQGGVVA